MVCVLLLCGVCFAKDKPNSDARRQEVQAQLAIPDPLPELGSQRYDSFKPAADVAAERVSYATGYGSRVPGLVYHLAGLSITQRPAIVVVPGDRDDKSSWYVSWAGVLFARAGAVVLTYDSIGEYERDTLRQSNLPSDAPADLAPRLSGLRVTDILQAVRYLASRKDVDAKHIAVVGFSTAAGIACEIDNEIDACMLTGDAARTSNVEAEPKHRRVLTQLKGKGPDFLTRNAALWLEDKLKFPDWTKKEIERMQETNVEGTAVLGGSVSAPPRSELHAIPDIVWRARKDDYTYEGWLNRMRQSLH